MKTEVDVFLILHHYCSEMKDDGLVSSANSQEASSSSTPLSLERKQFSGRYAISSEEFTNELVSLLHLLYISCSLSI